MNDLELVNKKNNTFSRRDLLQKAVAIGVGFTILPSGTVSSKNRQIKSNGEGFVGKFIEDNFLLNCKTAEILYHEYAKKQPIIDYHNHLPPSDIANNRQFENLTKIWLDGDHYKWRAMRANGIEEKFITGNAPDREKFRKWAETVPYTLRNPLYHWTHLELKRYFDIDKMLNPTTADEIFDKATDLLQTDEYRVQNLIKNQNVEVVCTTDDPVDSLSSHQKICKQDYGVNVLPAWRPDKAMAAEDPEEYNRYLDKLSEASAIDISRYQDLLTALKKRQEFFHDMGCRLSDHGMETFYTEDFTDTQINKIFLKIRSGNQLSNSELLKLKSALLMRFAEMNYEYGWTQQFHFGPIRNNNTKMLNIAGPDAGYDSIGDFEIARPMSKFFDQLEQKDKLTKSIVYNLNPKDNALVATMIGNFNSGTIPGKMQYGSAWWFMDQKDGIERQLNTLSNMGLLGRFVGMTTDSRSFLSYSRHEYFRRVLCNLIGSDVEKGELPADTELLGDTIKRICYDNAKAYFKFTEI